MHVSSHMLQVLRKGYCRASHMWLPEYADKIEGIISHVIDLASPFQKRFLYHWQFNGSYSIKSVLPALVPELGYDGMEIRDGEMERPEATRIEARAISPAV